MVLMRHDGEVFNYNFESEHEDIQTWINRKSLRNIEELSPEVYKVVD